MFKLDNELIKDRFAATSFSFYTDKEIERLSVKQILNPTAFDHLSNPTNGGIYDKTLGVSPFDHRGQCVTCGLDCQYCPGHLGYIELTGPCYNPFLINQLYKLLKSKCVKCHRIRIHPRKVEAYVQSLKLIKSGQIVGSQVLKNYFLTAAKEVALLDKSTATDGKKLLKLKQSLEEYVFRDGKGKEVKEARSAQVNAEDYLTYFRNLDQKFNSLKEDEEEAVTAMFEECVTYNKGDLLCHTSILQKTMKEIVHEIWSSVVPTTCPHCQEKSPAFRKDGYTKFFVKPYSDKVKNQMKQTERLIKHSSKSSHRGDIEDGFEVVNDASTTGAYSRKGSRNDDHTTSAGLSQDEQSQSAYNFDDEEEEENDFENLTHQTLLLPNEVQDHLENMWRNEKDLLDIMFGRFYPTEEGKQYENDSLGPQMFFMRKLIVPPNRFRPESQGAFGGAGGQSDKAFLHAHSAMIQKVLTNNLALKDAILKQDEKQKNGTQDNKSGSDISQKWIALQDSINTFMDSSMAQKTADKEQNGIRQLLERKEGMFRMKMMGKRVNYGGRSVISPDPYITTDQIGVPIFMARKLTFPESVSEVNAEKLRKLVMNGPKQHPGANMIEDEETGIKTNLEAMSYDQRRGLAQLLTVGKKIVYRHLNTGDVLLVNRQPTLHKPSIMAHVARILPKEQTIRMHYANCSTYNADFDGDEMNLHFPQSYHACSEAYKLMATHKQYIVPTSGKPIRGLIQDSVVSGVFLTSKDTFLTKEIYQQLVYVGLRELIEEDKIPRIFTLPPALLKPQPRWTGKQVVSTIIKNIVNQERENKANRLTGLNLDSKAKLSAKEWGTIGAEEGDVIFRDNELLLGTLDKNQFGASEFGLVHSFYEIYGSEKAGELLTSLARIFTVYLQMHGFTCGLEDLVITPEFNKQRRLIIENAHKEGIEAAAKFCGIKNYQAKEFNYSNRIVYQSGKHKIDKDIDKFTQMSIPENPFLDKKIIQADDPIRKRLEEKMNASEDVAALDAELDNVMRSKMSQATSQILKVCIPDGLVRRFPRNNISAMVLTGAKGGLVNMTQICCLLGQQELEGKRVPKMQNGKTLPCFLPYDPNPRSSGYVTDRFITGLRPQDFYFHCMAGREGLIDTAVKTSRSGYLQRCIIKQLESLVVSYDMTVRDNDGSIVQFLYGEDGIDVMDSKYLEKFDFLEKNFTSLITSYSGTEILSKVNRTSVEDYKHKCKKVLKRMKRDNPAISNTELKRHRGDPALSIFHPQKYFGSISEKMDHKLKEYLEKDSMSQLLAKLGNKAMKQRFEPIKGETFRKMYYLKYMRSIVHPGENVGTLAGQSVGEPSTQMTLNTFHLAGHGAANMTLGIPRLKEILMTTPTNIKTPNMIVYFRRDLEGLDKVQMEMYANKFKRLKLSDVTKELKVSQEIAADEAGNILRLYNITIEIESAKKIKKNLGISFKGLAKVFSDQFITLLMSEIMKQLKKASQEQGEEDVKVPAGSGKSSSKISKKFKDQDDNEEVFDVEQEDEIVNKASQKSKSSVKGDTSLIDEDDEDNEAEDDEYNMDIDGVQKKAKDIKGYEQEDEEDQDLLRRAASSRNSKTEVADDQDQLEYLSNVFREKYAKYKGYIRKINFQDNKSMTVTLGFPLQFKKILMITVAEAILAKVLVRSVKGIENCILVTPDKANEEPYLLVQGLNFEAFYREQDVFDVNRIQSNDIWQIMKKYGVEAGCANLVKEVRQVFNMYGIEVNYRHLSLIGDFITFNGEYRAFNRIGMQESSSPFLKMSFETTMKYLIESCIAKDTDDLSTPASALVLGQVPKVGTGVFDIIHDPEYALA